MLQQRRARHNVPGEEENDDLEKGRARGRGEVNELLIKGSVRRFLEHQRVRMLVPLAIVVVLLGPLLRSTSIHDTVASREPSTSSSLASLTADLVDQMGVASKQILSVHKRMSLAAAGGKGLKAVKGREVVTAADKASHFSITSGLAQSYPALPVISEEGVSTGAGSIPSLVQALPRWGQAGVDSVELRSFVYLDPLDATAEFAESTQQQASSPSNFGAGEIEQMMAQLARADEDSGEVALELPLNHYVTIQACVVRGGRPVAGAILFPFTGRGFVAVTDDVDDEGSLWAIDVGSQPVALSEDAVTALSSAVRSHSSDAAHKIALHRRAMNDRSSDSEHVNSDSNVCAQQQQPQVETNSEAAAAAQASPPEFDCSSRPRLTLAVTRSHFLNHTVSDVRGCRTMAQAVEGIRSGCEASGGGGSNNKQQHEGPAPFRLVRAGGAGFKAAAVLEQILRPSGTAAGIQAPPSYADLVGADAYIHEGPIRQWDLCAASVLIRAAGGVVSEWDGTPHRFCLPRTWIEDSALPSADDGGEKKSKKGKSQFSTTGIIAAASAALHSDLVGSIRLK